MPNYRTSKKVSKGSSGRPVQTNSNPARYKKWLAERMRQLVDYNPFSGGR